MTELYLRPYKGGMIPADAVSTERLAELNGTAPYRAQLTKPRNLAFHRKFFALLQVGFEAWEPPAETWNGEPVRASRERFRKDLLILAGFYETSVTLDGRVVLEPKSISFASMDETEFQQVYDACLDVLIERVLHGSTREDINDQVNRLMEFA